MAGMVLEEAANNTLSENTINDNMYGIVLAGSSNRIYHNNFINNSEGNAYDYGTNIWDNGYPSGGNYWDDFDEPDEGAWDNDSDGIVDTPYDIPGEDNQDKYPLMNHEGRIQA
ncbi:unnamed protein product, partial [marine sediment metagenome]